MMPCDVRQTAAGLVLRHGRRGARLATLIALGSCSGAAAAATVDIANERIPVDPLQLEAHWGIDCAGTVSELDAALRQLRTQCLTDRNAGLEIGRWREALRLCAAVHNPPGAEARDCRDFGAALKALPPGDLLGCADDSPALATTLSQDLACP